MSYLHGVFLLKKAEIEGVFADTNNCGWKLFLTRNPLKPEEMLIGDEVISSKHARKRQRPSSSAMKRVEKERLGGKDPRRVFCVPGGSGYLIQRKSTDEAERESFLKEFLLLCFCYAKTGEEYVFVAKRISKTRWKMRMTTPDLGDKTLHEVSDEFKFHGEHLFKWFAFFGQACRNLSTLHERGFAVLDINPDNIVRSKFCSFGMALFKDEFERDEKERTSLRYRPGGQLLGLMPEDHGYHTDVYSLVISFLEKIGFDPREFEKIFNDPLGDVSDAIDVRDRFFRDQFKPLFHRHSFPTSLIEELMGIFKSMMAFCHEDRFSSEHLTILGNYLSEIGEGLLLGTLGAVRCDGALRAELDRCLQAMSERDEGFSEEDEGEEAPSENAFSFASYRSVDALEPVAPFDFGLDS